jgi:hypothetical protein
MSLLAVLARDLAFYTAARRMLTNCAIETKTFFRENSLPFAQCRHIATRDLFVLRIFAINTFNFGISCGKSAPTSGLVAMTDA